MRMLGAIQNAGYNPLHGLTLPQYGIERWSKWTGATTHACLNCQADHACMHARSLRRKQRIRDVG